MVGDCFALLLLLISLTESLRATTGQDEIPSYAGKTISSTLREVGLDALVC